VLKIQNDDTHKQTVSRQIDSSFIQFHFCLKGNAKFIFNEGRYALEVPEENSLLLYNTRIDFTFKSRITAKFLVGIDHHDDTKISFLIFQRS